MSTFDGQDLFAGGPVTTHVGGLMQRHELHELPGADGAKLTALGATARRIEQRGTLIADDPASLRQRMARIEAMLDGRVAALVDEHGATWPGTVMLAVAPSRMRRTGARWAADCTITYVQTHPEGSA